VRVVEELGEEANGHAAELKVVAIPDDVQWVITKVDGLEHVSEVPSDVGMSGRLRKAFIRGYGDACQS